MMKRVAQTLSMVVLALVLGLCISMPAKADGSWFYEPYETAGLTGWMITDYGGNGADVVIPSEIDELPVIAIGKHAFANDDSLYKLTIPASIVEIKAEAFYGCSRLTQLNFNADNCAIPDTWIYDGNKGAGIFSGAGSAVEGGFKVVFGPNVKTVPAKLFDTASLNDYGVKGYDYAHVGAVEFSSSVTAIGTAAFRNCDDLTSVTLGSGLRQVGTRAFWSCDALTELTCNKGLTTIGEYAFGSCTGLTDITWGTSLNEISDFAFSWCLALETVSLPDPLVTLGRSAFADCHNLHTVTLPKSLVNLKAEAFCNCRKLAKLTINSPELSIPSIWIYDSTRGVGVFSGAGSLVESGFKVVFGEGVTTIAANLFDTASLTEYGYNGYDYAHVGSVEIPSTVTSIGTVAFRNCDKLTSVTLGSSLATVGDYAFWGCDALASLTCRDALTGINQYAFAACTALKNITWGKCLETIGMFAFADCTALETVSVPNPVTTLNRSAFSGCTALKNVTLPESLTTLCAQAFYNCRTLTQLNINSTAFTVPSVWIYDNNRGVGVFSGAGSFVPEGFKVVFAEGVTAIPDNLFDTASLADYGYNGYDYAHVGAVEMSSTLASVGTVAFRNCDKLTSVKLGSSIATVGDYAFWGCDKLASLTCCDALTAINQYAFANCIALTDTAWGNALETIGMFAFADCTALETIAVPNPVTTLNRSAFSGCTALKNVTLPESLTSLCAQAFYNCGSLEQLNFNCRNTSVASPWIYDSNRGVGVFSGAGANVEGGFKVVFGGEVEVIPANLFDTASLTDYGLKGYDFAHVGAVEMSSSITEVGTAAFRNCDYLASVTMGSGVVALGSHSFWGCNGLTALNLRNTVTVGDYSFNTCAALSNVNWGAKLETIGAHAFNGCSALVTADLPEPLATIGIAGFANCTGLKYLTLPESLTSLRGEAFYNNTALERIEFNCKATSVAGVWIYAGDRGAGVFSGAGAKAENDLYVVFGPTVTSIPKNLFLTASLTDYGMKGYDYAHVKYAFIPANVTAIGENAFRNCKDMTRVTFMHGADAEISINTHAFEVSAATPILVHVQSADALTAAIAGYDWTGRGREAIYASFGNNVMDMPAMLTTVEAEAFQNSFPQTVIFQDGTKTLGANAFADCEELHLVYLPASVDSIAADAFSGSPNVVFICPRGSAAASYARTNDIYYVTGQ